MIFPVVQKQRSEGNTQQIEQFIENFDIEYFEEKCIECGWEILQNEVERIFERRDFL